MWRYFDNPGNQGLAQQEGTPHSSFLTSAPHASCRNFSSMVPAHVSPAFVWRPQHMSLSQKAGCSFIRLPKFMITCLSLAYPLWPRILGPHRTRLHASSLESLQWVEATSILNPPPSAYTHHGLILFSLNMSFTYSFYLWFSYNQWTWKCSGIYKCKYIDILPGIINLGLQPLVYLCLKENPWWFWMPHSEWTTDSVTYISTHRYTYLPLTHFSLGWCSCWLLEPRLDNFSSSWSVTVPVSKGCHGDQALRMAPSIWELFNWHL